MSADHDASSTTPDSIRAPARTAETPGLQAEPPLALPGSAPAAVLASPRLPGRGNGPVRQAAILQLQRAQGNRATQRFLQRIQNDADGQPADTTPTDAGSSSGDPGATQEPAAQTRALDQHLELSAPAPIAVPADQLGSPPGDYPTPGEAPMPANPPTVMAKRAPDAPVQRDNDAPHASGDASGGVTFGSPAPWSLQVTGVYRNLNLGQIKSLHLDLGHEPNISLQLDSSGGLSTQVAMGLINWHWLQPWNRELEVGLSAVVQRTLLPQVVGSGGGQLQAEQHIVPWFSVTVNVSGMWTPPKGTDPGQFAVTGGLGALVHFDGF